MVVAGALAAVPGEAAAQAATPVVERSGAAPGSEAGAGAAGAGGATDTGAAASALVPEDILERQMDAVGIEQLDRLLQSAAQPGGVIAAALSPRAIVARLRRGESPIDVPSLARDLALALFREAAADWRLLGQLVLLAILSAMIGALQGAFEREGVGQFAQTVCYLALVNLALGAFLVALRTARGVVADMVSFMLALFPTLVGLLAAGGAPATAALFHPLLLAVVQAVSVCVADVVFPLLFLAAAVDAAGCFAPNFQLGGLAGVLRQAGIAALGLLLALFLGAGVVAGAGGSVADSLALKSAKFVSSTFVPVVGRMFSDAAELVLGSSLLLKNAVGIAGAAGVIGICALPLCKILALLLTFRLSAALSGAAGGEGVAANLNALAGTITLLFVATLAVALMFFLVLTAIMGAGSGALLR